MSFSLTIKAGDSYAFRFPALEPKPNAEIWAEGGGVGGISSYWADFAAWVAGGKAADEGAFLADRAPNVVPQRVVDLTGWGVRADMRDGSTKIADLDVQMEAAQFGGLVLTLPASLTETFDAKTYDAQIEFSDQNKVISSDVIKITVKKDVTYD